ncbi:hypothetical protein VP01_1612g2 [Puccinia sorghi]|uniref:Uncharacterized protein n=1 Tax=Puccinia sorghi TaxID=27349 RepID=A0A0L6VH73_9BASI|nr:hypothetical protein VP01_1612g2 [Puccinia sorghi]
MILLHGGWISQTPTHNHTHYRLEGQPNIICNAFLFFSSLEDKPLPLPLSKPILKSSKATVLSFCICIFLNDRGETPLPAAGIFPAQCSVQNHSMLYIIKLILSLGYSLKHCDCIIAKGFFYLSVIELQRISTELRTKFTKNQAQLRKYLHVSAMETSLVKEVNGTKTKIISVLLPHNMQDDFQSMTKEDMRLSMHSLKSYVCHRTWRSMNLATKTTCTTSIIKFVDFLRTQFFFTIQFRIHNQFLQIPRPLGALIQRLCDHRIGKVEAYSIIWLRLPKWTPRTRNYEQARILCDNIHLLILIVLSRNATKLVVAVFRDSQPMEECLRRGIYIASTYQETMIFRIICDISPCTFFPYKFCFLPLRPLASITCWSGWSFLSPSGGSSACFDPNLSNSHSKPNSTV